MVQFELKNDVCPHFIPINGPSLAAKLMGMILLSLNFVMILVRDTKHLLKLLTPYFLANNEIDMHQSR